jgi:exodeoxyribonuclease III
MTFRIITCNVNGLRAAHKKGFTQWLEDQQADIICLQETKAPMQSGELDYLHPKNYLGFFHDAQKKGYSGVGIYSKQKPKHITRGLGWPCADDEGRFIAAEFEHVYVASIYLPSGTSGPERQQVKYDFMARLMPKLEALNATKKPFILCGDWNIAHQKMDLKNWRNNQKNSGFLPEERAWLDELFEKKLVVDAFRVVNQQPEQYTWWTYRANAFANNVGWRIDYQMISASLQTCVKEASIIKKRFSDHAPLIITYDLPT